MIRFRKTADWPVNAPYNTWRVVIRSRITGEIIWSSPLGTNPGLQFSNGLKFLNRQVLFIARMIEQLSCIQKYRESQARQYHRTLSGDAAARKWIRLCAARFPSM